MTEKKYLIVEVCNPKCPFMTDEIENFCSLEKEMVLCKFENCPQGKTIDEMCKEIHYAICVPCTATANDACNKCPVHLGSIEDGLKALLGGGGK